ncbi:glycosyltransferase [Rhodocytophaga rosea]|uniref:Glycosyltransferase n=1 Tax=Rhodocytophaga rosea TaxID=2704465 RepID=A0A6C0GR56_9BACT|nr:glycosyltransferase family 2 protein [Rhodocytophaga rosea]QHT70548.1 glycosyltransferase [Rhodocytophaga rosea]
MAVYPKITIITPSYNQGQYLEQTIQSVLSQSYPNLEYIIVDGGSTDHSVEIIKKYEKHLAYWISEKDQGQSHAINKGLQKASGDIINWLNSDDFYEPQALHTIAAAFENPSVLVVCGRGRLFRNLNETAYYSNGTDVYSGNVAKTIGWARIDQPETFFKASVIQTIGPLDTRLHYLMDRDWWIKFLFTYGLKGIVKTPEILVNFRLHDTSKTVSQGQQFQIEHDTFFYSLAKQFNLFHYVDIIKQTCQINEKFALQTVGTYDVDLVEKSLTYFLLRRANEFYAQNNKAKTKLLLQSIQVKQLASADQGLFRTLYFRNKYIPSSIINLLRKR